MAASTSRCSGEATVAPEPEGTNVVRAACVQVATAGADGGALSAARDETALGAEAEAGAATGEALLAMLEAIVEVSAYSTAGTDGGGTDTAAAAAVDEEALYGGCGCC
jgi:hypothetical protein